MKQPIALQLKLSQIVPAEAKGDYCAKTLDGCYEVQHWDHRPRCEQCIRSTGFDVRFAVSMCAAPQWEALCENHLAAAIDKAAGRLVASFTREIEKTGLPVYVVLNALLAKLQEITPLTLGATDEIG